MKSRFRKWFIFLFLVFAGCPMMKTEAQAAVAQITIQKSQQDIVKGDVFYVIVTVTSDEEILKDIFLTIRMSCSLSREGVLQAVMMMKYTSKIWTGIPGHRR